MNSILLLVMSITGLLALYWVLFGQWKYNKVMKETETIPVEVKETETVSIEAIKEDDKYENKSS